MPVYQGDTTTSDDGFEPCDLSQLVPGNPGRLLDARRTPVSIVALHADRGFFEVRIETFEDKGATWLIPLEDHGQFQMALGSQRLGDQDIKVLVSTIVRVNHTVTIDIDPVRRSQTNHRIDQARTDAHEWLSARSPFPKPDEPVGSPELAQHLQTYLARDGLLEVEREFATTFVSNPNSGDMVRAHIIAIAELGLVAYHGKQVRDPVAHARHPKDLRQHHVIQRLGFVRALFALSNIESVCLFRGMSMAEYKTNRPSLVSATFSKEVAQAHFGAAPDQHGALLRQWVSPHRVFMSYHETAEMNQQFKEAEAILLGDPSALF